MGGGECASEKLSRGLACYSHDRSRSRFVRRAKSRRTIRQRTIWIATNSKGLAPRFYRLPSIVDILPSISLHMRFDISEDISAKLDGVSFLEILPM